MLNDIQIGQDVTMAYVNLIKNEIQLSHPNFFFDKGSIIYDYEEERYIYPGFTAEEQSIILETVRRLRIN